MKLILQIIAIILVVSTLCICFMKPELHKTVIVYNSDYKLVPEEVTTIEKETIPIMEAPVKPHVSTVKAEKTIETPKVQTTSSVKKTEKPKTQTNTVKKAETKTTMKQPETVTKKEVEKPVSTTKTVQQTEVKTPVVNKTETVKTEQPKALTQQEEEIAWNIWRSNLQNKIMKDVFLPPIPEGTVFKFAFNVDKFGRVSNVQTYATPSSYTPYAIQYIAPVIRSYQGKSILNFPQGSTRTSTEVKGGWKISVNERYSTPQDYNDVEKVVKP